MTVTLTGRRLGQLTVQTWRPDWIPDGETSSAPTLYQPTDTYLQNDGQKHWWLPSFGEVALEYDGTGWVATTVGSWSPEGQGHIYRLARDGEFVSTLTLADGFATLDRGRRYAIRVTPDGHDLYEL